MSNRLQVLIPPKLDARLQKAAHRGRISKGEWVRRAIESSLNSDLRTNKKDSLKRLASLNAPTADIARMLEEIERGRPGDSWNASKRERWKAAPAQKFFRKSSTATQRWESAISRVKFTRSSSILREIPGISARDALHAAVMRNHDLESIATFDSPDLTQP